MACLKMVTARQDLAYQHPRCSPARHRDLETASIREQAILNALFPCSPRQGKLLLASQGKHSALSSPLALLSCTAEKIISPLLGFQVHGRVFVEPVTDAPPSLCVQKGKWLLLSSLLALSIFAMSKSAPYSSAAREEGPRKPVLSALHLWRVTPSTESLRKIILPSTGQAPIIINAARLSGRKVSC